jgi:uncharacterized protein
MILKALLVLVGGYIIYLLFFKKKHKDENSTSRNKSDKMISDDMIECQGCKTFVSLNEAIVSNGKFYCSKDCLISK